MLSCIIRKKINVKINGMWFIASAAFTCSFSTYTVKGMFRNNWVLTLFLIDSLQQLQAAVEKRNEIISQLSCNLQVALLSRDQVQLEAQQLTGQIQEVQQQLHQVGNRSHIGRLIVLVQV